MEKNSKITKIHTGQKNYTYLNTKLSKDSVCDNADCIALTKQRKQQFSLPKHGNMYVQRLLFIYIGRYYGPI